MLCFVMKWREKFLSTESVIVRKLKGRRRTKERHAEAMGDLFAWLFNLFLLIFLIAILGYQIICLVDLESDYINLFDSTSRMNRVIMLEFIAQAVFSFVHLPAPIGSCFWCHFHAYSSMSDCRFWFPESINSTEQHYFTIGLWDHYWRMVHEIQLAMKAWYFKNGFSRPTDHGLFGSDFTLSLKNVV